jgi:poly(A) polymerase
VRKLNFEAVSGVLRRPMLKRLMQVLNDEGEETRLVGGAVRNALLWLDVADIDLATTALPDVTMTRALAAGFKAIPTGIEHGTITVIVDHTPFEVTSLREDIASDGRHATVRFGRDFRQDALRRDFTINALFADATGNIMDEVGGVQDLIHGYVRFIGDARTRIREDYLRILRFFRFSSAYGEGPLDQVGLEAVLAEGQGLSQLSRERIRMECLKLLNSRRAIEIMALMQEQGLIQALFGADGHLKRFERAVHAHLSPVIRLAALLVRDQQGAAALITHLRLSNEEGKTLHLYAIVLQKLTSIIPMPMRDLRALICDCGLESVAQTVAVLGDEASLSPDARALLQHFMDGAEDVPNFPVRGSDLLALGFKSGPHIGVTLEYLKVIWLDEACKSSQEDLLLYAQQHFLM